MLFRSMDDPFFRRFFGGGGPNFGPQQQQKQASLGSGVIVDASGLVVTNNHVIEGASEAKVMLGDKREFDVEIVLKDPRTDLAVLRIKDGKERFPTLDLANSDELLVGEDARPLLELGDGRLGRRRSDDLGPGCCKIFNKLLFAILATINFG